MVVVGRRGEGGGLYWVVVLAAAIWLVVVAMERVHPPE